MLGRRVELRQAELRAVLGSVQLGWLQAQLRAQLRALGIGSLQSLARVTTEQLHARLREMGYHGLTPSTRQALHSCRLTAA